MRSSYNIIRNEFVVYCTRKSTAGPADNGPEDDGEKTTDSMVNHIRGARVSVEGSLPSWRRPG